MDKREKRIFESAKVLFFRYGFKKTSLNEIISHAKVGKGAIYEFYKNKEELFKSIVLNEYDRLFYSIKEMLVSEVDPNKKILLYICMKIKFMKESILKQIAVPDVFMELKDTYDQMFPTNYKEIEILRAIIGQGQKNKIFRLENTEEIAKLVSEIIHRFEMSWLNLETRKAEKKILSLVDLLLKGLLV